MMIKNKKGYLKDKYIKNSQRFWNIEHLKSEITPNRTYIVKNNELFYIEREHIEKMSKKTIINNYGIEYFISHFTKKYLEPSKGYILGRSKNIDYYLHQITYGVFTSLSLYDKIKNNKVIVFSDGWFYSKSQIEDTLSLKEVKEEYNLSLDDIYNIVIGVTTISLRSKLNNKGVVLTDETKIKVMSFVESYIDYPVVIHEEKYIPVFTKQELKLAQTFIDFKNITENTELTNSQVLRYFNKTKSFVAVETKARHGGMTTAPRWYRKSENKKLESKTYREVERNIKNGDYDLVTAKAIKYVKNGSWYF